ncbi:amino acid permease [Erysipelothrix larvae]|uniref:Amino acid permease n=1 Tax=Erysipelothrix larvae TaxID=1514105 RepID=A0A0X8H0B7_9FIRM|nr:APC family permease [Erysipelothrix larvae]AMC93744.1 amino acid permease [Erysipelothrix larvae]
MSRKKFGFWSIVLLTINSIIGTGIFLSPQGVIATAGTLTPLIYIAAAIFAGVLAMVFASAAKYVNKNGAGYAYAKAAFGNNIGLYVGITRFVSAAIAWGVMGTAVVRTTLSIFVGASNVTTSMITLGFIVLMSVLLVINLLGNHIVQIMNNVSTIGKISALVVAISAGFIGFLLTGTSHFGEVRDLVPGSTSMDLSLFVAAVIAAFYAFTGFESVASATSEMENPEANLPKAIPLAMGIIALIYIGVVSSAMIANPQAILNSEEVVVLASAFDHPLIKQIIVYGSLVSMFGINIAASFSTPRVFQAMAQENQIPQSLAKENSKGIPVLSFVVTALLAVVIPMAFQYDMKGIMVISSISRFVQFIVVPMGVIAFYYGKAKNEHEVLKTARKNFVMDVIIPIIGLCMVVLLLVKFDWVGQFSMKDAQGVQTLNMYAISAMVVGYVLLPFAGILYTKTLSK